MLTHKFIRALTILGIWFFLSPELWALKVQVGSFFEIDKISYKRGRIVLPVTRRKYHNIRVLNHDTFRLLESCKEKTVCKQNISSVSLRIMEIRPAITRQNMWIADVSFA